MAKSKKADVNNLSFEDALSQLDTVVESLEGEVGSLASLVDQYDRGMKLLEHCHRQLSDAKQRVVKINDAYEAIVTESTSPTELSAEDQSDELF